MEVSCWNYTRGKVRAWWTPLKPGRACTVGGGELKEIETGEEEGGGGWFRTSIRERVKG